MNIKVEQIFFFKSFVYYLILKILNISWVVVAKAFNPSTWEAEAGRFLSSRPAWSTE
jgi:major histocompatibility complex class I